MVSLAHADILDEVESLTGSRTSGGSEPGDALRVGLQLSTILNQKLMHRWSMQS
jgi:hypothetical protein